VALPSAGRFSASNFLPDVRRFGATYFNYVGKPLAYVLATPERPDDADNPLVRAFGNEGATADLVSIRRTLRLHGDRRLRFNRRRATVARTPDTPPGALGPGARGTVVLDAETGEECPVARFDNRGRLENAEVAIGELVSKGGGAGFEGYWRNEDARRPDARRLVLDRGSGLPRRGGFLLFRRTRS